MKKFFTILFLLISPILFGQTFIDDSNFEDKISKRSAFGDDETNIVVVHTIVDLFFLDPLRFYLHHLEYP